jgi:gamma-polyglutamate synthase
MKEIGFLFWIILFLLSLGLLEVLLHRRNRNRVPVRIHVNGTRGKSSVTRLIAAGLREGGIRTCAKSTGTLPRMILPDGGEYPVFRPSRPNVIEQIRIFRAAAACGAQALVIECMALQPYLQVLCEKKLIQATHGVITNARADHLEIMGPTEVEVARALAGMIPAKKKLFSAEQKHAGLFREAARDRKAALTEVSEEDVAAVTGEDLAGFSYVEHAENVALALKVCADLSIDRDTALRGMRKATPDPGAMSVHEIRFFGRRIHFVNGFAANDPESTERIWRIALDRFPGVGKRIAIFNCRADRPERSQQLGSACVSWPPADHYVLIGSGTYLFARAASKGGLDSRKLTFAEDRSVSEIFESVIERSGPSALVMGMGNIGGDGLALVQYFGNRSGLEEKA